VFTSTRAGIGVAPSAGNQYPKGSGSGKMPMRYKELNGQFRGTALVGGMIFCGKPQW
jgi:hypothetical protein